jgi:hypothetical protein
MSLGPPQPKPQPQVQSQPQNQHPSQNQPPTGRAAVSVVGGTNGILANVEDLRIAARTFGAAARSSATDTLRLHGALFGQDLAGAAVLDPAGAARFEATLLEALDGPTGLAAVTARCAALGVALDVAAATYLASDDLHRSLDPVLQAGMRLPGALDRLTVESLHGRFGAALDQFITADPALVDLAANGIYGRDPVLLPVLGDLDPDGHPKITALPPDPEVAGPPRNLADVINGLAQVNDGTAGQIGVQILTGTDATGRPYRKVIVDIPGISNWSPRPGQEQVVTNLGTTTRALSGESTTYEQGVIEAMRAAGVRPTDDVMLVGHSLGGLIAVEAASALSASGEFNVTHVITAGAPIGAQVGKLPTRVQVLALENDGDIVPEADGRPNPDLPNVTTATVHHNQYDLGADHDLEQSYLPGAQDVDSSDDVSLRSYLDGASEFFTADAAENDSYQITRTFR